MSMRLSRCALIFTLAAFGQMNIGCSSNPGGSADAGSADGSTADGESDDGPGDASAVEGDAQSDAAFDASPADGPVADAGEAEAATDSGSGNDAAPADATVSATGTLIVTADAWVNTTTITAVCAAANSLVVNPDQTRVGDMIQLTASGVDPSGQSADVTLTWSADGGAGMLTGTTGTSNAFGCAEAGTEVVTVTAAISDGGASCEAIGSLTATLTCTAP